MFRILNKRFNGLDKVRRCSSKTVLFKVKDKWLLFDVNAMTLIECDKAIGHGALRQSGPGLLFKSTFEPYKEAQQVLPVRRLCLNLSQQCNLACTYCFSERAGGVMTGETMQLALEMLDETRPVDIGFFGGEPLLYLGALEEATELAVKLSLARKVASKFHLTTNATLITEYAATFLRDQGFTVLVSLDGPADLHNKHRGGHAETMRGLLLLKAAGVCQVMARATYVPDAISLRRRAEYLYGLQKRGLIKAFSIEPASGQTWDGEVLSQEYGELGNWYVEQIKAGERPDFFHFRVFLQRLRDAQPHLCSCGAGNSYITIGPDGTLYACHRQGSSEIGHVKVGFDETKRNEWLDGRLFNHQDCCDCWAKFVCGGGCREAHCQETGWRDCPGSSCVPTRAMIMESMWVLSKLSEK